MSTKSLPPLPNPVEQPTMAVEVAAGYLGIQRPAAYAAAPRSGELPTVLSVVGCLYPPQR